LLKEGWRPKRTIILASWDAEEYGMVGSTEWVEDHKKWLSREAICYLNVDMAVSGPYFEATGSPSLKRLLYDVAKQVPDPKTHLSVYDSWLHNSGDGARYPFVGTLGSGSDYVAFIDHVGIASMDIRFSGEYGVYHSNYDSLYWMDHFGDPSYTYHVALTQIWGLMALRLSSDRVLDMHAVSYADSISDYYRELKTLASPLRTFSALELAIEKLSAAAELLDAEALVAKAKKRHNVDKINDRLAFFERWFIDPQGIKGREWFKHVLIGRYKPVCLAYQQVYSLPLFSSAWFMDRLCGPNVSCHCRSDRNWQRYSCPTYSGSRGRTYRKGSQMDGRRTILV
jgi:N-acetylated-alpha-linked acidic dipeptidase